MTKTMLTVLAMLTVVVAGALPVGPSAASAQEMAEGIAVTGTVSYEGTKADGTPIYGITDESTLGMEWYQQEGYLYQQEGYLLEGDYGAYVGKRVTVHGTLEPGYAERVLDVSWIVEEPRQNGSTAH